MLQILFKSYWRNYHLKCVFSNLICVCFSLWITIFSKLKKVHHKLVVVCTQSLVGQTKTKLKTQNNNKHNVLKFALYFIFTCWLKTKSIATGSMFEAVLLLSWIMLCFLFSWCVILLFILILSVFLFINPIVFFPLIN